MFRAVPELVLLRDILFLENENRVRLPLQNNRVVLVHNVIVTIIIIIIIIALILLAIITIIPVDFCDTLVLLTHPRLKDNAYYHNLSN